MSCICDPAAEPGDDEATYPTFQQTAGEFETRIRFMVDGITNWTDLQADDPKEES